MKNKILLLMFIFLYTSCEDVIEVDLNTMEPKLVIEASINWIKGTAGNQQNIKLSLTSPFFDKEITPATGAIVQITDQNKTIYKFIEEDDSGIYTNRYFVPKTDATYTMSIIYNNEEYIASETLKSVVDIDYVAQNVNGGFVGERTELKAYYTDPIDETNFYFFEFRSKITSVPSLEVYEDTYTNGNQIFGYYSEEDLTSGDEVTIRNHGISEQFYNYMFILLQQSSEASGGPFETQPAVVKGNCVNKTNPDNFPLGYFRLSEVVEVTYTIQ